MVREHRFASGTALAVWLARTAAATLRAAVRARGRATLVVSGGQTPRLYLPVLARQRLPWSRVKVTLTDERWVRPPHPQSNETLIRTRLLRGPARAARLVPLRAVGPHVAAAHGAIERALARLPWPADLVLLGMGDDGHVASLFPGDPALHRRAGRAVAVPRPQAGFPRCSLTLRTLGRARRTLLVLTGTDKAALWRRVRAAAAGPVPVAHWLAAVRGRVDVALAPAPADRAGR